MITVNNYVKKKKYDLKVLNETQDFVEKVQEMTTLYLESIQFSHLLRQRQALKDLDEDSENNKHEESKDIEDEEEDYEEEAKNDEIKNRKDDHDTMSPIYDEKTESIFVSELQKNNEFKDSSSNILSLLESSEKGFESPTSIETSKIYYYYFFIYYRF